jgi:glycosyltransferase involved in cell wall biosynthesis
MRVARKPARGRAWGREGTRGRIALAAVGIGGAHARTVPPVRVHIVDPSAYTPPYDHALCSALAALGVQVQLITSRFDYGPVAQPQGYRRRELFYGFSHRGAGAAQGPRSRARVALKLAEHVPQMLHYRRLARAADIAHFQWLTVQPLDVHLLPRRRVPPGRGALSGRGAPALVLTAHDVLPREPRPGQLAAQRRLYERFDAIVVHSQHGRTRLIEELHVEPVIVHTIPHGAFAHLAQAAPMPPPHEAAGPVVLCFGLMRPYKGLDLLMRAWRGIPQAAPGAELWVAGMPRMDISALRAAAPPGVRFDARFIPDHELPAYFQRADLIVLPYREIDQSGVLFTALAFGKPLLLTDVGGFPEVAATGAARLVPANDAAALHEALRELLADPAARAQLTAGARAAAAGPYSWERVAQAHVQLYAQLLAR